VGTGGPLVVVGDALLDRDVDGQVRRLSPDAPAPVLEDLTPSCRPGGAALAARLAAADGVPVVLVAPLGDDEASQTVLALLQPHVTVVRLPLAGTLPEKTRFRTGGHTLLRADRGDGRPGSGEAGPAGLVTDAAADAIAAAGAILVSDYGRGVTADPQLRSLLERQAGRVPLVWDPHPKGAPPVPRTRLVTPNLAEALAAAGLAAGADVLPAAVAAARELGRRWSADAVAVTLGERGAVLVQGGTGPLVVPAPPVAATDPCGAGDRFAAAAATALQRGALASEAVTSAVASASAYLEAGGVGRYGRADGDPAPASGAASGLASGSGSASGSALAPVAVHAGEDAVSLARRVRAAGGAVVATGGCFDLLHAGHVSLLQTARSLGDCLIVCLNSDDSVRRLKGDGRPLNHAGDRAAVLAALGCVDAIAVFGEDTPCEVLDQLRPDVWVKGGDYDGRELPEAARLETWGGVAVTVPYLSGRSTTRLAALGAVSQP
jgi:rfaE bifunctional protein nucleotidyltransferase chain/domain/rfaE bifunctional protein kinase chain/domain